MLSVAIVGASGFTGAELLRILAAHPAMTVVTATGDSQACVAVGDLYPSLGVAYPDLAFSGYEPERVAGADVVFFALPHGASQRFVPALLDADTGARVVDLAADFRLRDPAVYEQWYGQPHQAPEHLDAFAYGLPELFRDTFGGAAAVAAPGCYPTAAALALAPLVRAGAIEPHGVIVDAASGVSGAGRPAKPHTSFCAVDEDFVAYGLLDHRHTPEIEQATGAGVLFTPHLAPMNRGILATCYARPAGVADTDDLLTLLAEAYAAEPFVTVRESPPSTKATLGANSAHLTARFDARTGWVMALCALDNLGKGASGQAVQCANLLCGLEETTGLATVGVYP
ncbi:MAG: N-acetyl-gamma-glutamyl-phosphate reductase [Acidimicrobiia bacterium]|nr:N-acetyl-gamma-glutamyl-phosphate reductase [Acidimicrobiia bacterium]